MEALSGTAPDESQLPSVAPGAGCEEDDETSVVDDGESEQEFDEDWSICGGELGGAPGAESEQHCWEVDESGELGGAVDVGVEAGLSVCSG